jgi:hypothetical protein
MSFWNNFGFNSDEWWHFNDCATRSAPRECPDFGSGAIANRNHYSISNRAPDDYANSDSQL